jgi:hypothetical protein
MEQGESRGIEDKLQERPRFGSELGTIKQNITVSCQVGRFCLNLLQYSSFSRKNQIEFLHFSDGGRPGKV